MRTGILGGSFNPIHNGHLAIARAARAALGLDRVVLVISARPPHKQGDTTLAPPEDRLAMARLAVLGEKGLEVSDLELEREGPSYTIDTVRSFLREDAGGEVHFIVGADGLSLLSSWKEIHELLRIGGFAVVARPGFDPREEIERARPALGADAAERLLRGILPMTPVAVSATEIRARVEEGRSIEGLVPEAVREYISARGLYRKPEASRKSK
ncbi:nicotinate (nicotinamide) nucleotide adenylyltransferase [bacterium]|nr:nicotinate (nicotinamide) nucleotide adenylyltransferase [bacterium]